MNNPKMRGLKQCLISLRLYNNNKFIDGKTVEMAHQIGKLFQVRHNNFQQAYKATVSKSCFHRLSLLYIFNGGKWGQQWQYQLGKKARRLKDPDNPSKPHPIIERFLIADAYVVPPLIQVKALVPVNQVSRNYWNELFANTSEDLFLNLIKKALNINQLTMNMIKTEDEWQLRKVKSFQFNKKNQTFTINFASNANATAIVKIATHFVMKFKDVIQVTHHDDEILLCYGAYWPIYDAPISNDWINTGYASMDYVKANEIQYGWNFMNNINEPVF